MSLIYLTCRKLSVTICISISLLSPLAFMNTFSTQHVKLSLSKLSSPRYFLFKSTQYEKDEISLKSNEGNNALLKLTYNM